jgi:hypothetical protein
MMFKMLMILADAISGIELIGLASSRMEPKVRMLSFLLWGIVDVAFQVTLLKII